jgi:hypothetical protein
MAKRAKPEEIIAKLREVEVRLSRGETVGQLSVGRRCVATGRTRVRPAPSSLNTTGKERRITRWEHEHVAEAVQERLDANPQAMRVRRETAEHPFGTLKARMGATHFLMKRLPKVATEMALHVLAYNLTQVMNIIGIKPLMAAIAA